MSTVALVARLLRFRSGAATALMLVAAVVSASFTATAVASQTLRAAALDSVVSANAGFPHIVQALDAPAAAALGALPETVPVSASVGDASHGGRAVSVTVLEFRDPAATPGRIIQGRRPARDNEAVVSRAVSLALRARTGDRIGVRPRGGGSPLPVTITGVTVDPGRRAALSVAVQTATLSGQPTSWLSRTDPGEQAALRASYERGALHGRTTELLAADSFTGGPLAGTYRAARLALPGLFVLGVALIGILMGALMRELAPTVSAMAAAGFGHRSGRRFLAFAGTATVVIGTVAGAGLTIVAMSAFRGPLSSLVGQYWTSISVPILAMLSLVLIAPAVVGVAHLSTLRIRFAASHRKRVAGLGWGVVGLGTSALLYVLVDLKVLYVTWAMAAAVSAVVGAVVITQRLRFHGLDRARRQLLEGALGGIMALSVVSVTLAVGSGLFAAGEQQASDLVKATSNPLQPAGSLLVLDVNAASHRQLAATFTRLGGTRQAWYITPDETRHQLRVTTPTMVTCIEKNPHVDIIDLPLQCVPSGASVAPNVVMLASGATPAAAGLRADPSLIENGQVGLLEYRGGVTRPVGSRLVAAVPDPTLGGNLAGAVTSPNSQLAGTYDLRPSGGGLYAMFGVDKLAATDAPILRDAVIRYAPTAQIAESTGIEDAGSRGRSLLVAVVAAALLLFLVTTGSGSLLASQLRLRQTLGELGVPRSRRLAFAGRVFLVPLIANVVGLAAATLSTWFLAGHRLASAWWWTAPGIAAIAACLLAVVAYSQVRPVTRSD